MSEALSSLAETFKNVGVSGAYGAPAQVDGEESTPVALVSFGFGGGGSDDADGEGNRAPGPAHSAASVVESPAPALVGRSF